MRRLEKSLLDCVLCGLDNLHPHDEDCSRKSVKRRGKVENEEINNRERPAAGFQEKDSFFLSQCISFFFFFLTVSLSLFFVLFSCFRFFLIEEEKKNSSGSSSSLSCLVEILLLLFVQLSILSIPLICRSFSLGRLFTPFLLQSVGKKKTGKGIQY